MKRVVVSGATGFIGRSLVAALLERGDDVVVLTRDPGRARGALSERVRLERWNPQGSGAAESTVEADAVVNLAGEQAVGRRWSSAAKRNIIESRVLSTEALVRGIERSKRRPSVFVCASAVG